MNAIIETETISVEEQEKRNQYREMIFAVRQDLKDLHEYWISKKRGLELREDNPYNNVKTAQTLSVPGKLTALHNFYLEIRGRDYRHGTEDGFFRCWYSKSQYNKTMKELQDKYLEELNFCK